MVARHRTGVVSSTGGTPSRMASNAATSTSSSSENAAGPGMNPMIPLLVNEPVTRNSRARPCPRLTAGIGSRNERRANPENATSNAATAM
jgi:hypothetical protein